MKLAWSNFVNALDRAEESSKLRIRCKNNARVMRLLMLAFALFSLVACVQLKEFHHIERVAEPGSNSPGAATIYVLRENDSAVSAWSTQVKLDDASQGWLRCGTFMSFNVSPGHHVVQIQFPPLATMMRPLAVGADFEADKTYYFIFASNAKMGYPMMEFYNGFGLLRPEYAKALLTTYHERH